MTQADILSELEHVARSWRGEWMREHLLGARSFAMVLLIDGDTDRFEAERLADEAMRRAQVPIDMETVGTK